MKVIVLGSLKLLKREIDGQSAAVACGAFELYCVILRGVYNILPPASKPLSAYTVSSTKSFYIFWL